MSMSFIAENIRKITGELPSGVRLVAVSKTHPAETVLEAYKTGQRIFGENRVQEMLVKKDALPSDIEWHLIGHLQTNKVRQIAPFVSMIHSVDSERLLSEISKEALRCGRSIDCLLQVHIATEETKFGMDRNELIASVRRIAADPMPGVRIRGLMGMATFTDDAEIIRSEFRYIQNLFKEVHTDFFNESPDFNELSIGMSGDYKLALEFGTTLVRIGTAIFGIR